MKDKFNTPKHSCAFIAIYASILNF